MKLRHPDHVKTELMKLFGLDESEAMTLIFIAQGEYGFSEPPAGEKVTTTVQVLAALEYFHEVLADLDANETATGAGSRALGPPTV